MLVRVDLLLTSTFNSNLIISEANSEFTSALPTFMQ